MSATGSNKQVVKLGPNVNNNSNNGGDYLYQFLASIQLESFLPQLRDKLQITRLSHFDYVKPKDLEKIGMSKPAIRRLLDAVSRNKKLQMPARPPPPAPSNPSSQSLAKSSVLTINKQTLSSNKLNSISANTTTIQTTPIENHESSVSQIISSNEIEFIKTKTGEDEILGTGHFGVVKKAVWLRRGGANKLTVAVKCLHHEGELNHQAFVDIVNEVSAMCNLNHPNLIKLHGIVFNSTSTTNNTGGMVMMVTELAPHGSLYAYLRKFKLEKKYPLLNQIYSFIYQIACGMEYLESKKLIHRDLAARNILLSSPEHVKICDFGMARSTASSGGQYKMNENHKIPCAWYAPESIRHKLFSSKSDVWAFGVTLWECFSLCEQPWPHLSAAEILGKLERESKRLSQPYLCSRSFYRVILSCWEYEPAERATFAALKSIIKGTRIVDMRAKDNYREDGRLEVTRGDQITIVDGCASNYWWKGQNKRTQNVGKFPRAILDPERKICGEDISMPLRNSFIHTGHMGADRSGRTWGNPGKIDDIFLRNPLKPPDLLEEEENDQEVETITVGNYKSQAQNPSQINQDVLLIDLSDSVDLKVSYPADNVSTKSLSPSLVDLAALAPFSISQSPQTQSQSYYENNQYMSERLMKNGAAEARPPPLPPTLPAAETSRVYYNDLPTREWTPPKSEEIYRPTTATNLKPTNPFYSKPMQATMTSSQYSSNYNTSQNFTSFNNEHSVKKVDFNGTQSLSMMKTNNLTVDDLLSKVMNDVLTDFNNLKP